MVSWSWKQPKPCLLGMQEILSPAAPECHLLARGGHHRSGRNLTCPGLSLWDFKKLLSNYTRGGNGTPTPVLLPGKSHGQRSLVGCSPWGREESDMMSDFTFTFLHWRRKWQPTSVFLPRESQGQRSLVGCRLWGRRVGHD